MRSFKIFMLFIILGVAGLAAAGPAPAAVVTFTGTVTYTGPYQADTLYVAVLDTTGTEDVNFLSLGAFPLTGVSFSQFFSLPFDNTAGPATATVAALLDVDGGGVDSVSAADILGWFGEGAFPVFVSTASSASGLDFSLPTAEIHGTLTFGAGQTSASIKISSDSQCQSQDDFRPQVDISAGGAYSMVGVYPGTWCVGAFGFFSVSPYFAQVCYGDPDCLSPTLVTLGTGETVNGVDLDFSGIVPVKDVSWGLLKSRY